MKPSIRSLEIYHKVANYKMPHFILGFPREGMSYGTSQGKITTSLETKMSKRVKNFFFHIYCFFPFFPCPVPWQNFKILSRPVPWRNVKIPSGPVPWQDFELVPLSLCPVTMKNFLSLCPARQDRPVLLETLFHMVVSKINISASV